MKNPAFDHRHLTEYAIFGFFAALLFVVPVWIYLYRAEYVLSWVLFLGSLLFMIAIMSYCIKLSKRRSDYESSWMMIVAPHMAVLVGIVLSVLFSLLLCFIYIPGFMTGHSPSTFLHHAPTALNKHNTSTLVMILLTATFANFGAGSFIAFLGPYVFKPNQTKENASAVKPGM